MAGIKPLIDINKINNRLIFESFCNKPHDFYIAYNDDADELIIRLTEPKGFTSLYYLDDNHALVIDLDRMEIVGMELINFTSEYMVDKKELREAWETQNLAEGLAKYHKAHYSPEKTNKAKVPSKTNSYNSLYDNACKEFNVMMA